MNKPMLLTPETLATQTPPDVKRVKFVDRGDWMKLRAMDVTASVAGALFHEHQYVTALGLYLEKAGMAPPQEEVTPVMTDDSIVLPPIIRGTLFERTAIEMVRMLKPGWTIFSEGNTYYRMPSERIGATPDAVATRPDAKGLGIIQIKTTDNLIFRKKWMNEAGEVEIPAWIAVQAIVEAKLTGATWACVAVMIGGVTTELKLFDIPIHDGVWTELVRRVREFWRRVEQRDAPEPDYLRDGDYVRSSYLGTDDTELDLSTDNRLVAILDERNTLKIAEKAGSEAEKKRKALDAELISKMGAHTSARAADGRVVRAKNITVNRKPQPASSYTYPRISISGEAA
ncbi:YqaJ viral recombinase family nuclease [Bosea sp. TAF32]|uniref:YqaJ viral recombinase family nuclease n=1 Tax=Bosea sp. TAF32 TaxID=3237482 RepID=UPI003F91F34C